MAPAAARIGSWESAEKKRDVDHQQLRLRPWKVMSTPRANRLEAILR
jgi:hypothetical protein